MSEKLKPCPFCGSNEVVVEVSGEIRHKRKVIEYMAYAGCAKCFAKGGTIMGELKFQLFDDDIRFDPTDEKFKERAIEAWNRRENNEN